MIFITKLLDGQNDEIITNANFETSFGEDENIVTLKRSISDPILQGGFIYSETDETAALSTPWKKLPEKMEKLPMAEEATRVF